MSVLASPHSPYKGLAAYDESDVDALLFFGRERETEVIAANLQAARLTVLYGPSGVGKSSILRAGVARKLRQEPDAAVKIVDSWAGDPAAAAREAVDATPDDVDVYLVLDQFEEYFVYHRDADELPRLLRELTSDARSRINVLIGIREDALANLDAFRRAVPSLLTNRLQLDLLDRASARDAILKPLARYSELTGDEVEIEPALVERILDEVAAGRVDLGRAGRGGANGGQADRIEAPYLQLVLQTLFEAEGARGSRVLREETLDRLGGSARIVHEHLEHAMAELTADEKQAAAKMYNHLVTPSGTKIAYGVGDLAGYASLPESQASRVLEKLAHERILRATSDDGPAATRYEIFHDVLADAILAWRSRHEEQQALGDAERRRRRAFAVATAALVGLILVGAIAVFALVERGNARSQARRAHAEALAAESLTDLGIDPSRSLGLAYDAARLRRGKREESVLRTALLADRLRGVLRAGTPVVAVAYDASGRHELVAAGNGKVRIYNAGSSRPLRQFDLGEPVKAAAISADGRSVAAGGDGVVRLWRGAHPRSLRLPNMVRSVAFVDGRLVAASQTHAGIWRLSDGKRVAFFPLEQGHRLVKLVVSPDGRQAVAKYRFRRADVLALPSGRPRFHIAHNGFVQDVAYSPDGRLIVSGGYDGDVGGVRLWDARTGRLVRELKGALLHVDDVTFSRDGKLVGAASADGTARIWETNSGTETAIMIGHQNAVTSVDFNRAGTAIVSGSTDGTARVWGAAGGKGGRLLNVLAGHRAPLVGAVFSPDGRAVLTGGTDGTARVWDPGSEPALAPTTKRGADVSARDRTAVLSASGLLRAQGLRDGTVRVVDVRSGHVLWAHRRHIGAVTAVSFSPDDKLLASAGVDHDALVWDVKSGYVVQRLHGHFGPVADAEFSPDSRWVVTAGPISAGLWLVGGPGSPILLEALVTRPLSGATFAGRDGHTIVAGSRDGSILSYRCDICGDVGDLIALARRRLAAER